MSKAKKEQKIKADILTAIKDPATWTNVEFKNELLIEGLVGLVIDQKKILVTQVSCSQFVHPKHTARKTRTRQKSAKAKFTGEDLIGLSVSDVNLQDIKSDVASSIVKTCSGVLDYDSEVKVEGLLAATIDNTYMLLVDISTFIYHNEPGDAQRGMPKNAGKKVARKQKLEAKTRGKKNAGKKVARKQKLEAKNTSTSNQTFVESKENGNFIIKYEGNMSVRQGESPTSCDPLQDHEYVNTASTSSQSIMGCEGQCLINIASEESQCVIEKSESHSLITSASEGQGDGIIASKNHGHMVLLREGVQNPGVQNSVVMKLDGQMEGDEQLVTYLEVQDDGDSEIDQDAVYYMITDMDNSPQVHDVMPQSPMKVEIASVNEGNEDEVRDITPQSSTPAKQTSTEARIKCKDCSKTFKNEQNAETHYRKAHLNVKHVKCPKCDKMFAYQSHLKEHSIVHTDEKPFPCDICEKSFRAKSLLKRHKKLHMTDKQFECKHCSKKFHLKEYLNVHMRTHTGENPYLCPQCGKSFKVKSALNVHMQDHTGSKPFKCHICSISFKMKGHLNVHLRTHSSDVPYLCHLCCSSYRQYHTLKVHLREKHNILNDREKHNILNDTQHAAKQQVLVIEPTTYDMNHEEISNATTEQEISMATAYLKKHGLV